MKITHINDPISIHKYMVFESIVTQIHTYFYLGTRGSTDAWSSSYTFFF